MASCHWLPKRTSESPPRLLPHRCRLLLSFCLPRAGKDAARAPRSVRAVAGRCRGGPRSPRKTTRRRRGHCAARAPPRSPLHRLGLRDSSAGPALLRRVSRRPRQSPAPVNRRRASPEDSSGDGVVSSLLSGHHLLPSSHRNVSYVSTSDSISHTSHTRK